MRKTHCLPARPRAEVAPDRRQRDVDDRRVDEGHRRAQDRPDEHSCARAHRRIILRSYPRRHAPLALRLAREAGAARRQGRPPRQPAPRRRPLPALPAAARRRARPDRDLGAARRSSRRSCCARILDTAIPSGDTTLLTLARRRDDRDRGRHRRRSASRRPGCRTLVGQQVMHDLRTAVYRHLQRLSLAFFTRTRTGEVQSRIANDIGGVDIGRDLDGDVDRLERDDGARDDRRDVPARLAARALRARRCCRSSCWLTPPRRRASGSGSPPTRQQTLADISTLVEESLSVSGILLGQDDGPLRRSWPSASRASRSELARPRGARSGWPAAG